MHGGPHDDKSGQGIHWRLSSYTSHTVRVHTPGVECPRAMYEGRHRRRRRLLLLLRRQLSSVIFVKQHQRPRCRRLLLLLRRPSHSFLVLLANRPDNTSRPLKVSLGTGLFV